MKKAVEYFGWVAVGLILLAYGLVTLEIISPSSVTFQLMNMFGAVGIIASSLDNKDWQPIVLNIVWFIIASVGLIRSFL